GVVCGPLALLELIRVGGRRQRARPARLGSELDVDPVAGRKSDHVPGPQPSAHVRPVHSFAETLENAPQLVGRVPSRAGTVLRGDLTQQIAVLTGGEIGRASCRERMRMRGRLEPVKNELADKSM